MLQSFSGEFCLRVLPYFGVQLRSSTGMEYTHSGQPMVRQSAKPVTRTVHMYFFCGGRARCGAWHVQEESLLLGTIYHPPAQLRGHPDMCATRTPCMRRTLCSCTLTEHVAGA